MQGNLFLTDPPDDLLPLAPCRDFKRPALFQKRDVLYVNSKGMDEPILRSQFEQGNAICDGVPGERYGCDCRCRRGRGPARTFGGGWGFPSEGMRFVPGHKLIDA